MSLWETKRACPRLCGRAVQSWTSIFVELLVMNIGGMIVGGDDVHDVLRSMMIVVVIAESRKRSNVSMCSSRHLFVGRHSVCWC